MHRTIIAAVSLAALCLFVHAPVALGEPDGGISVSDVGLRPDAGPPLVAIEAPPPQTIDGWAAEYRSLRAQFHSGLLPGFAALVLLLSRVLRTRYAGRLLDRLPSEWRWTIPAAIGVLVIMLPELAAGIDWWRAGMDGLLAALAAIGAHSAVIRDLLGFPSPRAQAAPSDKS